MAEHPLSPRAALHALQAAALLLPGLVPSAAVAQSEEDRLALQYSRVEEGRRSLQTVRSDLEPLHADTLRLSGSHNFNDTHTLRFAVSQDTWSGATPVSSAPLAADPNRGILRDGSGGLVVSGASPYLNATFPVAADGTPLRQLSGGTYEADPRTVLVMSSASPEIRKQVDLSLGTEVGAYDASVGLTVSTERDYLARGLSASIARDLNQQLTTLSFGISYSEGRIDALLDPDALPYLDRSVWQSQLTRAKGSERLSATRHDARIELGLTQVIDAQSYVEVALGHSRASGYLGNPYKAVSVLFAPTNDAGVRRGELQALMEVRPDEQKQDQLNLHYARALPFNDGALHASYAYSSDSWDIRSHSFELQWVQPLGRWTFTPHIRWYRQQQAEFYVGYLTTAQAWRSIATDELGRQIWTPVNQPDQHYYRSVAGDFLDAQGRVVDASLLDLQPLQRGYDRALLPTHYSSDHRIASFGSVNGGFTLSRRFTNGLLFEAGIDFYRRRGGWGLGDGENNDFADFRFTQFNLGLQFDFGAHAQTALHQHAGIDHAQHTASAHSSALPAGVRFVHDRHEVGALSFGYQAQFTRQGGSLGEDATVAAEGCDAEGCRYAPRMMTMQMHMLMVNYQVREDLNLMLMPQYMSMDMGLRELANSPPPRPGEHVHGAGTHQSGSIGDTVIAAIWQPLALSKLQVSLGLSAPTGKTDLEYRRQNQSDGGLMHFDMQTGSGTWDLLPTLTWQDAFGAWNYGAQLSAVARLQKRNSSGYSLGDQWQLSTWLSHPLTSWLAGSARLTHTWRDEISGDFDKYNARMGPMDFPFNQGGRYTDLGLGLSIALPANQHLALEWEEPVQDEPNGFQLEREGQWNLQWHLRW